MPIGEKHAGDQEIRANIVPLPRRVSKGKCPFCQQDISFLWEKKPGTESEIHFCPLCGQGISAKGATLLAYKCGSCDERIIDQKQRFCHSCGAELGWKKESEIPTADISAKNPLKKRRRRKKTNQSQALALNP